MGNFKVRYLIEKPSGYYYRATPAMKRAGIFSEPLGTDLAAAIARAEYLNVQWDAIRNGDEAPVVSPSPPGTLNRFVEELRRSAEYLDKAPATQDEIEYALATILPVFGKSKLSAIKPTHVEIFYSTLREQGSLHRAHRMMKWLRYLLNRAVRLGRLRANAALAVRVRRPKPREQVWNEKQVESAIETAWKERPAIAVALAIAYDTGLRPVDIRKLTCSQIGSDRVTLTQVKTEKVTHLPIWPETVEAIERYLRKIGVQPMPNAVLLRTRRGRPYTKDYLAKEIRNVLTKAKIPKAVQLRDLRRTASKERAEADATEAEIAAAGGWSIERGSEILDVYNPRSFELARKAQEKRRQNKRGRKV